ncbi:MAG TPA: biotin--[acetyl-CoA-carboxylase] ligase [Flavobacteriaceae bacterium]|nr:biotin--[acetyl-CoA-carboxylase] ligase [Flavobacteriaceae bacterium]
MQYIKVLATDSTNTELKKRFREDNSMKNTCLVTDQQNKGRGQRKSKWQSKDGMNLTFSLLLTHLDLDITAHFKLSALVSLALAQFIRHQIPKTTVSVKWPNDILADSQKICGILIENFSRNHKIHSTIIGVGLNVNQTTFKNLPKAGSLKNFNDQNFYLDELLVEVSEFIETTVYEGLPLPLSQIIRDYEAHLFRINQISTFQFPTGVIKKGIISGIQDDGKLLINFKGDLKAFALKEIKLLY